MTRHTHTRKTPQQLADEAEERAMREALLETFGGEEEAQAFIDDNDDSDD